MKKVISLCFCIFILSTFKVTAVAQLEEIKINFNGKYINMKHVIVEGNTLIPLTSLGYLGEVVISEDDNFVCITLDNISFLFQMNKKQCKVDYWNKNLTIAPQIINGVKYVPLRFICEQLGAEIGWDSRSRSIYIIYLYKNTNIEAINAVPTYPYGAIWSINDNDFLNYSKLEVRPVLVCYLNKEQAISLYSNAYDSYVKDVEVNFSDTIKDSILIYLEKKGYKVIPYIGEIINKIDIVNGAINKRALDDIHAKTSSMNGDDLLELVLYTNYSNINKIKYRDNIILYTKLNLHKGNGLLNYNSTPGDLFDLKEDTNLTNEQYQAFVWNLYKILLAESQNGILMELFDSAIGVVPTYDDTLLISKPELKKDDIEIKTEIIDITSDITQKQVVNIVSPEMEMTYIDRILIEWDKYTDGCGYKVNVFDINNGSNYELEFAPKRTNYELEFAPKRTNYELELEKGHYSIRIDAIKNNLVVASSKQISFFIESSISKDTKINNISLSVNDLGTYIDSSQNQFWYVSVTNTGNVFWESWDVLENSTKLFADFYIDDVSIGGTFIKYINQNAPRRINPTESYVFWLQNYHLNLSGSHKITVKLYYSYGGECGGPLEGQIFITEASKQINCN